MEKETKAKKAKAGKGTKKTPKKEGVERKLKENLIPLDEKDIEIIRRYYLDEITAMESYFRIAAKLDGNQYAKDALEKCEMARKHVLGVRNLTTLTYFLNVLAAEGLFEPAIRFGTTLVYEFSDESPLAYDNLESMRSGLEGESADGAGRNEA